jgi:hypothetical protein
MQAEKAAFEEAEKKIEEEVLTLFAHIICLSFIGKLYPWQYLLNAEESFNNTGFIRSFWYSLFICSFLTPEFGYLPGSEG